MKAVIQRCRRAAVRIAGEVVAETGAGLMVLVCVMEGDTEKDSDRLASKIAAMRIFSDEAGKMNLSVIQTGGDVLVVSQFTLAGDIRKGHRPSFISAASPAEGERLYLDFCRRMEEKIGKKVAHGVFGADMEVELINDGPVTIIADTSQL